MKRSLLILGWICVVVTAVFLRFDDLGSRPLHADEATGARITAERMEGEGEFNPTHYHGPLLADLAGLVSAVRGEHEWENMTEAGLRILPAIAGVLLVLSPLLVRRYFGDGVCLASAALISTSPLLVYYSRMFIHESLLVLFGVGFLLLAVRKPKVGLPGVMLGLMYATKETFVISVLAWGGAAVVLLIENRDCINKEWVLRMWGQWKMPLVISAFLAGIVSMSVYTDAFRHPQGAVDAVKTFFVYKTGEGHDKGWFYYLQLLLVPEKSAGRWWYATPMLLLAIHAYVGSYSKNMDLRVKLAIRFLSYAAVGHLLIYSTFAYKTPWLMCLPWAHVGLLSGFSVHIAMRQKRWVQAVVAAALVTAFCTQYQQAKFASGRLSSDYRNPLAYVPTRKSVIRLEDWLHRLRSIKGADEVNEVAVVGSGYWPLPWYLREFERVGYWPEADAELKQLPIVICMPEQAVEVMGLLEGSHHQVPFGYGLRPDLNVEVFVQLDLWEKWSNADEP